MQSEQGNEFEVLTAENTQLTQNMVEKQQMLQAADKRRVAKCGVKIHAIYLNTMNNKQRDMFELWKDRYIKWKCKEEASESIAGCTVR